MDALLPELWMMIFEYFDIYTLRRAILPLCRSAKRYAICLLKQQNENNNNNSYRKYSTKGFPRIVFAQFCIKRMLVLCFNFTRDGGNLLIVSISQSSPKLRVFSAIDGTEMTARELWSPSSHSLMVSRGGDVWVPDEFGPALRYLSSKRNPSYPDEDLSAPLSVPISSYRTAVYDEHADVFLFLHDASPDVFIVNRAGELLSGIACENELPESVTMGYESDGYSSLFVLNVSKRLLHLHRVTAEGDFIVTVPYSVTRSSSPATAVYHPSTTRVLLQRPDNSRGQISSIAVDSNGKIFATSERQLHVSVYDSSGKYEMSILDREDILDSWLLRIREDGRLFVLGQVTGQVFVL